MAELPKIVRERLKAAPAEAHPDANLLTAFAERSLGKRERAQVLAHLAACATCREVVALARPHEEEEGVVSTPRPARWWGLRWQTATALATVAVAALVLMIIPNSLFRAGRSTGPQVAQAPAPVETTATTREQGKVPAADEPKAKPQTVATAAPAQLPAKKEAAPAGGGAGKAATVLADAERRRQEDKDRLAKGLPAAPEGRDQVSALATPTPSPQPAPADRSYELRRAEAPPPAAAPAAGQPSFGGLAGGTGAAQKAPAAKAAPASSEQAQNAARVVVPATSETVEVSAEAVAMESSQWRSTTAGKVEHSTDAGQSWRTVNVAAGAVLNAVAAVGEHVWAGGHHQRTAVLYYSADSGAHWTRLDFTAPVGAQAADVVALNFTDARHGVMTVVAAEDSRLRQIWTTADGGRTWSAPPAR